MKENTRSTDYNGALPDTRTEAREDGALWEYAHMYDVIKEDKQRVAAVDEETAARKAADAAEAKARADADASEEAARKAADAAIYSAIDKEAEARIAGDSALSARVDDIDTTLEGVATKTDLEDSAKAVTNAYQAADQNIIDQNATAMQAEQDARGKADTALGTRIDSAETAISTEATRAKAAEKANADAIAAEATAREAKDTELETAVAGKMDADAINSIAPLKVAVKPTVNDAYSVAIGNHAVASNTNSIGVGTSANSSGNSSIALGAISSASGNYNIAIGANSSASSGYAFGYKAKSTHQDSIAFGTNVQTTEPFQVVFGSTANPMKLSNVRAGEADTDAVNKKQLDDAIAGVPASVEYTLFTDTDILDRSGDCFSSATLNIANDGVVEDSNNELVFTTRQPVICAFTTNKNFYGSGTAHASFSIVVDNQRIIGIDETDTVSSGYPKKLTAVSLDSRVTVSGTYSGLMFNFSGYVLKGDTFYVCLTYTNTVESSLAAYLATLPDIEHGYSDALSLAAGASTSFDVTFSSTKTEAPQVLVSVMGNGVTSVVAVVQSATTTGATVKVTNLGSSAVSNVTVDWLALSGR